MKVDAVIQVAFVIRFAGAAACCLLWQNPALAQSQIIERVAGKGSYGYSGDGGPALQAEFVAEGIVVDHHGNIFLADSFNKVIRQIDGQTKIITTYAGTGQTGFNGEGLPARSTNIGYPAALALDKDDNLIIAAAYPSRVLKVNHQSLQVETLAGTDVRGLDDAENTAVTIPPNLGDGGPAKEAWLYNPTDVAIDSDDNLYIADTNYIRRVNHNTGIITTVLGGGKTYDEKGWANGPASSAELSDNPFVAIGPGNLVYFGARFSNNVRRLDPKTNSFSIVAGVYPPPSGPIPFSGDGIPATHSYLNEPTHITFDCAGNLTISDFTRVRQVDAKTGLMNTIAGNNNVVFGAGSTGDGGLALQANIGDARDSTFAPDGSLYIVDSATLVRRVSGFTGTHNWDCRDERRYHGYDPEGPEKRWHHEHEYDQEGEGQQWGHGNNRDVQHL